MAEKSNFIRTMGILGAALGVAKATSPEIDLPLEDMSKIYENLVYIGKYTLRNAALYVGAAYMFEGVVSIAIKIKLKGLEKKFGGPQ